MVYGGVGESVTVIAKQRTRGWVSNFLGLVIYLVYAWAWTDYTCNKHVAEEHPSAVAFLFPKSEDYTRVQLYRELYE